MVVDAALSCVHTADGVEPDESIREGLPVTVLLGVVLDVAFVSALLASFPVEVVENVAGSALRLSEPASASLISFRVTLDTNSEIFNIVGDSSGDIFTIPVFNCFPPVGVFLGDLCEPVFLQIL